MTVATLERVTRIELAYAAWEAAVLPLNYTRVGAIVDGRGQTFGPVLSHPIPAPALPLKGREPLPGYSICSGANGDSSFNDHFSIVPAPGSS
jgi:hypothetical protein